MAEGAPQGRFRGRGRDRGLPRQLARTTSRASSSSLRPAARRCCNLAPEFLERITADHYVVSADGRDGNPETETLELIEAARADDDFTIHLTNHGRNGDLAKRVDAFLAAKKKSGRAYAVNIREDPAPSIRTDLLDGS